MCSLSRLVLSSSNRHLCFLPGFSWLVSSFFLVPNNIPLSDCVTVSPFIHSSIGLHLGCFRVLAVTNKTAADIHVQVLCGHKF